MNKIVNLTKKSWLVAMFYFLSATSTLALSPPTGVPNQFRDLNQTISTIFNVVILVSSIVFVVLLLIGGIQYLTSAGNEESAGKARKLMLNAVIGLVIVLAAWGIGGWIIKALTGSGVEQLN